MFRQSSTSIRTKLIATFAALVLPLLALSGYLFHTTARESLDRELGHRLVAVAQATVTRFNPTILTGFRRGDQSGRTYGSYRASLLEIRDRTGLERIFVFDPDGRSIMDTRDGVEFGSEYARLSFQRAEMRSCLEGQATASVLFRSEDGRWYKSGFAPVFDDELRAVAVVATDASAGYLDVIRGLDRSIALFVLLGAVVAVGLGFLLARTISRPVDRLVRQAERIGRGRLELPLEDGDLGNRELQYLATAMERMRQRLAQREENQRMIVAGVAHEIRNPLGGVEMFASLARQELEQDSEAAGFIDRVNREVASLKRIIGDFLEFARPSQPQTEPVGLAEAAVKAAGLLEADFSRLNARIQLDIPDGFPPVSADPEHTGRVLLNLLTNALEALPETGGIVRVFAEPGQDNELLLHVEDNGCGMDRETIARVFNPFFTTRDDGMGLGLAIVKKTLEENGAAIEVRSEPGRGSTFTIYFQTAARGHDE
ncbi:MAG: HAMP domain-containing protein [Candidatus Glassbacteria bacterium]|nr:HAMP domain-containing protein [Candidatus Glassbacteria bacterium]